MDDADSARVLLAIAQQGVDTRATPSSPILVLLTEFAAAGKLREVAEAFSLFEAAAHPLNVSFVRARIPGKILSSYLLADRRITSAAFEAWSHSDDHKDWAEQLKNAATNAPLFEMTVAQMREQLLAEQDRSAA